MRQNVRTNSDKVHVAKGNANELETTVVFIYNAIFSFDKETLTGNYAFVLDNVIYI